ncbi:DUF1480 domain-containing protein [Leclercia sp. M-A074-M]
MAACLPVTVKRAKKSTFLLALLLFIVQAEKWATILVVPEHSVIMESIMTKTNVRIGAFEIDDAELSGDTQGERTLIIPCKSDPDLCMQLDAWDADTSVPAILDGEHSVLYREHYDQSSDAWIMRLA